MTETQTSSYRYPLLGTRFVLDEEKILRDDKYDLEQMYKNIENLAKECGMIMIKIDKIPITARETIRICRAWVVLCIGI